MRIVVAPLHEVEAAIRRWRPSHLVSLGSPGAEAFPTPPGASHLVLTFHDIAEPRERLQAVTPGQVADLLDFAGAWPGQAPLLIHCWAGVSRSPAAAYAVGCAVEGPAAASVLAARLRAAAPFATPNARLVALADDRLGGGGALTRAIGDIGRGAETATGATFVLELSADRR